MTSVREYTALRQTLGFLRAELRDEKAARAAAERNAAKFHALLLQERIKHLPKQTNGRVGSPVRASADAAIGGTS